MTAQNKSESALMQEVMEDVDVIETSGGAFRGIAATLRGSLPGLKSGIYFKVCTCGV